MAHGFPIQSQRMVERFPDGVSWGTSLKGRDLMFATGGGTEIRPMTPEESASIPNGGGFWCGLPFVMDKDLPQDRAIAELKDAFGKTLATVENS